MSIDWIAVITAIASVAVTAAFCSSRRRLADQIAVVTQSVAELTILVESQHRALTAESPPARGAPVPILTTAATPGGAALTPEPVAGANPACAYLLGLAASGRRGMTTALSQAAAVLTQSAGNIDTTPWHRLVPDHVVAIKRHLIDNGTLTYSVTGLPPGLSYSTSSRRVSGSVSSSSGSSTVTYTVRDADGDADSESFTWRFTAPHTSPVLPDISNRSNPVGAVIDWELPAASGTPTPTYSLSGTLPSGLSFNASSHTVTGTIDGSAKTYTGLSYRATNSAGSDTETFDWTVTASAPSAPLAPLFGDRSNDIGDSVDVTLGAASGTTPISYSVTGFPSGLSTSGRTVSGMIGGSARTYTVTYRATNGAGSDTSTFDWTVTDPCAGRSPAASASSSFSIEAASRSS